MKNNDSVDTSTSKSVQLQNYDHIIIYNYYKFMCIK